MRRRGKWVRGEEKVVRPWARDLELLQQIIRDNLDEYARITQNPHFLKITNFLVIL